MLKDDTYKDQDRLTGIESALHLLSLRHQNYIRNNSFQISDRQTPRMNPKGRETDEVKPPILRVLERVFFLGVYFLNGAKKKNR